MNSEQWIRINTALRHDLKGTPHAGHVLGVGHAEPLAGGGQDPDADRALALQRHFYIFIVQVSPSRFI